MGVSQYLSWGRYPVVAQSAVALHWRDQSLPIGEYGGKTFLPYGNGRSYGDSCLNADGVLLDCRGLDRYIAFDRDQGVLRCEAGVMFADILELIVPQGWFLPVTPGTRFVTVGGAIANDVHGKNHHRAGTFGRHVRAFELQRSDSSRLLCTPEQNSDWFQATVGGLGLTGLITWAEFVLKPIHGPCIDEEVIRFRSLDEFFELSVESDERFEYTVAWIDCLASGKSLGRGLFIRGNHSESAVSRCASRPARSMVFPVDPPFSLLNSLTLRAFNALYYRKQRADRTQHLTHYEPFFYPLDAVREWNRIYGSKGFFQYQCVVPDDRGGEAMAELLGRIAASGTGSFLAVLKAFGDLPSPGLLSFPRKGLTLALDFPNKGDKTHQLMDQLDEVTGSAGGAVYPAKDARMNAADFQRYFPQWRELEPFIDLRFSSSFWRRVTGSTR